MKDETIYANVKSNNIHYYHPVIEASTRRKELGDTAFRVTELMFTAEENDVMNINLDRHHLFVLHFMIFPPNHFTYSMAFPPPEEKVEDPKLLICEKRHEEENCDFSYDPD